MTYNVCNPTPSIWCVITKGRGSTYTDEQESEDVANAIAVAVYSHGTSGGEEIAKLGSDVSGWRGEHSRLLLVRYAYRTRSDTLHVHAAERTCEDE